MTFDECDEARVPDAQIHLNHWYHFRGNSAWFFMPLGVGRIDDRVITLRFCMTDKRFSVSEYALQGFACNQRAHLHDYVPQA